MAASMRQRTTPASAIAPIPILIHFPLQTGHDLRTKHVKGDSTFLVDVQGRSKAGSWIMRAKPPTANLLDILLKLAAEVVRAKVPDDFHVLTQAQQLAALGPAARGKAPASFPTQSVASSKSDWPPSRSDAVSRPLTVISPPHRCQRPARRLRIRPTRGHRDQAGNPAPARASPRHHPGERGRWGHQWQTLG